MAYKIEKPTIIDVATLRWAVQLVREEANKQTRSDVRRVAMLDAARLLTGVADLERRPTTDDVPGPYAAKWRL